MKAIIVTVLMLASLTSLQAQVGAALTLACNGATSDEMSEDAKRELISMGIIVNFTTRTVQGFGAPGLLDYPVKVTGVDDVTVVFSGSRTIRWGFDEYQWHHRPHHGRRAGVGDVHKYKNKQLRVRDPLRAEMQTNTANVLTAGGEREHAWLAADWSCVVSLLVCWVRLVAAGV
jgi:hypothetical protein